MEDGKKSKKAKSRRERTRNMEDWCAKKAKRTSHDVRLFFSYFAHRGCDLQTARDLAMAKDGQSWN